MVEWKKLGEICELERGVRVIKKDLQQEGLIPVYQNSLTPLGYFDKSNYPECTPFVICAGAAGEVGFCSKPFWAADDCTCILCSSLANKKYIYYCLLVNQHTLKSQVRKASVPRLSKNVIGKLVIPIPSLEEQARIVGILDTFTASIDNLKEQIAQRRKQYEYYRDQLLDLEGKEGVEMKKLGEVCEMERGVRVVKKDLQEEGVIPVYQNSLTPLGYYEKSNYPKNTTFVICAGAAGEVGYSKVDFWAADDCTCIVCPISISSRYVYYHLMVKQHLLKAQVRKASVPRLSKDVIAKQQVFIPSLQEQQRIVSILDTFEASIQNLEAQLSQREKQYEYYRNKLLTFE